MRRALAQDALLIEIARFDVFAFIAQENDNRWWLPAHYAAWLIPAAGQGPITIIDLGEAEKIDAAVAAAKEAMKAAMGAGGRQGTIAQQGEPAAEKQIEAALAGVGRLVFDPLVPHFGEAQRLVISPDAALGSSPGCAADRRWKIRHRELPDQLRGHRPRPGDPAGSAMRTTNPVIFADPDYDLSPERLRAAAQAVLRGMQLAGGEPARGLEAGRSIDALRHALAWQAPPRRRRPSSPSWKHRAAFLRCSTRTNTR